MKQLAVIIAALLSLTLVAPALAQPFADVPTDHWAYDAIAELAAKGLIEGYPDGAFRGDRAMTRYEMAMVVARLLARIEAIKIPPLPTDLVRTAQMTKADAAIVAALAATDKRLTAKLATIQRLVAEFRAELAALGVRVTAVEEELAALKARMDNTRIAGDFRSRYNVFPAGSVNGPSTSFQPDSRLRARLTFTGTGGPNTQAVIRIWTANNALSPGVSTDTRFGANYSYGNVSFDLLYLDVRNTWGANLWRVGRQFYSLAPYGPGGGLLYDPANSVAVGSFVPSLCGGTVTVFCPSGVTWNVLPYGLQTTGTSDGIRSDWVLGPFNITAAIFIEKTPPAPTAGGSSGNPPIREDQIVRVTTGALLPGWTLGGSFYRQQPYPAAPAGTTGGTGYGFDLSGSLMPGVSLYVDWASWTMTPLGGPTFGTMTSWRVGGNIDLAKVAGIETWNPNLDLEYHNYGPVPGGCLVANGGGAFGACWPQNTYATTVMGQYYAWNMRGWLARLNLTFSPKTAGWILYEGGSTFFPVGTYSEWWLRLTHLVAPRTTIALNYYKANGPTITGSGGTCVGIGVVDCPQSDSTNFYRAELLYSW